MDTIKRLIDWLCGDGVVLEATSAEAPRGTVSDMEQAQKDIDRLSKLAESRIRT